MGSAQEGKQSNRLDVHVERRFAELAGWGRRLSGGSRPEKKLL